MISKFKQKTTYLIQLCNQVSLSLLFRIRAGSTLPGKDFDWYGRKQSLVFLFNKDLTRFRNWMCNPVSIVRYFEFQFAFNAIEWDAANYCLDISSPRLFFIYLTSKHPHIQIEAINPDADDLNETAANLKILGLSEQVNLVSYDATQLPYPDNSFDVITSISVIEHIPEYGDTLAMKEMWRVLKPGGKLVITVPCARLYYEEWRDRDTYGLCSQQQHKKYFFQRFYDSTTIRSKLFSVIGLEPIRIEVFGEQIKGTFANYEKRWIELGITETIKDPLHIVKDYKVFPTIDALPGIGICGLVFEKDF